MEVLILFALSAAIYLLPAIIATSRGRAVAPIWILNIFLGWTLLGWVAALVWASTELSENERIEREAVEEQRRLARES